MYSRATLLEIDTTRIGLADAVALFEDEVLPRMQEQEGVEGVAVLTTPEGKAMIVSFWATEEDAADASGFAAGEIERYVALFASPPGREWYEVAYLEAPSVTAV